jgi:TP901 family phage tail tape measure protein
MAAGDVALNLIVSASTGAAMSGLQGVGKAISDMAGGGVMGKIAQGAVAVTATLIGIGVASVKSAGDFQMSMTKLVTSAGESKSAIGLVSAGILQMSIDTGTSTTQLAAGMYYIESAGYHGAAGLNVLKVAAMGAKTEGADLDTVSKALTTVMVDYGMKSTDASKAMNGLIATVQNGKTNLQQLASSMGAVLPIASAMHISFPQVAGAMAAMTNAGMSAQQASQNLAHVLIALESPSAVASKSMLSVGLSAQQVKDTLVNQGLPQALQMIEDHVGKKFPAGSVEGETALKNIMGGLVGLKLAAMLTGPSLQAYKDDIAKISAAMKDGSGAVLGWSDIQSNFNFKMDQAKEALNVFMISMGTRLIPIISQVVGVVTPLITAFAGWISQTDILGGVSSTFSKILAMSGVNVMQLTHATLGMVTSGLQPLGDAFQKVGGLVGQLFMSAFKALLPVVGQFTNTVLPQLIATFNLLFHDIDQVATGLVNFFTKTSTGKAIIQAAIGAMVASFSGLVTAIGQIASGAEQVEIGLANVVTFFQKNQVAADALLIPLGVLGGAMTKLAVDAIASFIASLPEMIAGFVAWAAGAWAAAAGMIAATWPFLLVGAAVGLVIAGIVLAIQHWGAISAWLKGAWGDIVAFFQNIWAKITGFFGGIGKWFTDRFTEAKNGVQSTWSNIGNWFGDRWKNISDTAKSGAKNTQDTFTAVTTWSKNAWMSATAAIVNSFLWLYNHNYYFKDLCDATIKFFTAALAWIKTAWTDSVAWLSNLWSSIAHTAMVAWNAVGNALNIATTTISLALQKTWTLVTTWLVLQWNNLKDAAIAAWKRVGEVFSSIWIDYIVRPLTTLWGNISSWWTTTTTNTETVTKNLWTQVTAIFSTAWTNYIVKPLTSLWNSISLWFTNLATSFGTWAGNALTMFTNGITSGAKNVLGAITTLGTNIAKILGFHSPPASGPLSASDQWMPNMVTMMANGVTATSPKVTTSVNTMATGINSQFTNMNSQVSNSVNNLNSTVTNGFQKMSSNVQSSTQNINSSMSGLQTSIGNQSNSINTSITNMSKNVKDGLTSINSQVQTTSVTVPQSMKNITSSVQQSGPVVTGITTQIVQDFIKTQSGATTSSKQIVVAVNTIAAGAATIPKYADAFQQGSNEMSASAAEGMSKANKSLTTGAKQSTDTMSTMKAGIATALSDIMKLSNTSSDAQTALFKGMISGAKDAATGLAGIMSDMLKNTESLVGQMASSIKSVMGFSGPPALGPLHESDKWMPHMVDMLTEGLNAGIPKLASTAKTIASTLTGVSSGISSSIAGNISVPGGTSSSLSGGTTHITIQLDSKVLADATLPRIAKEIRIQGGVRKL